MSNPKVTVNAPEGYQMWVWMDNQCRSALTPNALNRDPQPSKRHSRAERRANTTRLRKFVAAYRLENLTLDAAATILNSNVRGQYTRTQQSVVSWLDGTEHVLSEVALYNEAKYAQFEEILRDSGAEPYPSNVLIPPLLSTPTEGASVTEISTYNLEALQCAKKFMRYPVLRLVPLPQSVLRSPQRSPPRSPKRAATVE